MSIKFRGNYSKLKKCVLRTGFDGKCRNLENRHKQFEQAFIAVTSANLDSNEARR